MRDIKRKSPERSFLQMFRFYGTNFERKTRLRGKNLIFYYCLFKVESLIDVLNFFLVNHNDFAYHLRVDYGVCGKFRNL